MPARVPTFKPPWINRPKRKRTAARATGVHGYGRRGWQLARRQALVRDGYQCRACGQIVRGKAAHVDHIKPKSEGGSDLLANLQTLCVSCHGRKTCEEIAARLEPAKARETFY